MQRYYLGRPISYFEAFLLPNAVWGDAWLRSQMLPFTQVAEQVAQYCGGRSGDLVDRLQQHMTQVGHVAGNRTVKQLPRPS
jgi:hypothetical protein